MTGFTIDLEPLGQRIQIDGGDTLLDAAQRAGVELISLCGGTGICGGCRVQRMEGRLTPLTPDECSELTSDEIAANWRLACQASPLSDVKIDIPPESLSAPQRLQLEGEATIADLDPVIRVIDLSLPAPSTDDLRADMSRLAGELGAAFACDPAFMRQFAYTARNHDWKVRIALRHGLTLVAALPPNTRPLGLAVDVGTTGLAAYLVDLETGETLAKAGAMNPQIAYGEDVISRIVYVGNHADGGATMQTRLVSTLNELVIALCTQASVQRDHIVEAVLVGNTVMHHLAIALPVDSLGQSPYTPITQDAVDLPAALLGLQIAPAAHIYLPPLIAGYVGADHVAMLLATDVWRNSETTIALDIGTNTEITLISGGQCWSCSCASGPAFEGAHIKDGMRAAPGAVERADLFDRVVRIQTIANKPAVGICGSGILDAVALMVESEVVDRRGALNLNHPLVVNRSFVLVSASDSGHGRAITVDRQDVSEVQLAKAAIRAGIELLLDAAGIDSSAIVSFVIAGAFGSYINVESAVKIGMFPAIPLERFKQVGNAAGIGACQLLVSGALRTTAAHLVNTIRYVELTTHPQFQDEFIAHLSLDSQIRKAL